MATKTMQFFYRYDGLKLVPGNKSAGFDFVLRSDAFILLSEMRLSDEQRRHIRDDAQLRIAHAGLVPKHALNELDVIYHEQSALPRVFVADPVFGGSLGADPELFSRLGSEQAARYVGAEVPYTPHNIDAPKVALALMLLTQAWADYITWCMPKTSEA